MERKTPLLCLGAPGRPCCLCGPSCLLLSFFCFAVAGVFVVSDASRAAIAIIVAAAIIDDIADTGEGSAVFLLVVSSRILAGGSFGTVGPFASPCSSSWVLKSLLVLLALPLFVLLLLLSTGPATFLSMGHTSSTPISFSGEELRKSQGRSELSRP